MKRLRIALAGLVCACSASAARAGDPLVDQASKTLNVIAREVGSSASMAGKAAAEALLAPSNKRKFATSSKTKRGAGSLGGSAAAAAAGDESTAESDGVSDNENAETDEIPLPVRKPKPVYGADAKAYETAGGKSDTGDGKSEADRKAVPTTTKDAKPADAKAPAQAASEPGNGDPNGKGDPKKGEPTTKAATTDKKSGEATEWPALEIELAKARCTQLLKGIDAVTVAEAPFRKGECGTPAPVRLVSLGKNPEVAISPPALVTCDMVAGLHKWLKGDLQPLARKHLGADIVRIETMSDYSCRRAYGRVANRLSEHGKANALDIRGFITAKANTAFVLEEWGRTRRDVVKQIAIAKAETEKAEAARLEAEKKAQDNLRDPKAVSPGDKAPEPPAATALRSGAPAGGIAKTTIIDGLPKLTVTLPGGKEEDAPSTIGLAPRHLGGPKDAATADQNAADSKAKTEDANDKKPADSSAKPAEKGARSKTSAIDAVPFPVPKTATSRFLHEAHVAACRIFGTTLGPEANEAHRNHFHVDMAERKFTKICE